MITIIIQQVAAFLLVECLASVLTVLPQFDQGGWLLKAGVVVAVLKITVKLAELMD